ncbi:receptor-interacting serine/threonine-protein kinase 1 isoform X2 [Hyla sarda]|uniref:receptor-interacting serine/threonine-protein kinase 1 isoform X2 n=1 Tax=Hyla sarda TaxID=327740 RepID=UPI0024C27665|nr:receptor-interacting serine/threonine-protein kinase 1 isoform X2 [Hyla sarda]
MEAQAAAADMSLNDIRMSSKELLDKKEFDSGGFGKVFICCHRKHGIVALKTVFTGFKNDSTEHIIFKSCASNLCSILYSYNKDLYEEGKMMYKLNHERIVKLLGIIIEDGNYALVIEYMTKGNLLHVLKQVTVPISVKARFILQIIEGMIYLHNQNVIHKDLKPENILANDEFHVKIADLGVAAFTKWSSLTKEETARQRTRTRNDSTLRTKNAGTLSYMAPEHLQSLNARATKKSDVYSFGIVIWVILTNKEPYENAINSEQLSLCVTGGDRPDVAESLQCGLQEASDLMEQCWRKTPEERPTFQDCEKTFRPVYSKKYEQNIEKDVAAIQKSYPKPSALIQRMASLQLDCDAEPPSIPRDEPLSLHSSLGVYHEHVNETLFTPRGNEPEECEEGKCDDFLERKLQEEMNYHRTGSRIDNMTSVSNSLPLSELRSRKVFSEANERNSTPVAPYPVNTPFSSSNEPSANVFPPHYLQSPGIFHTANRPVDYHQPIEPRSLYIPMTYPMWNTLPSPQSFQNLYTPDNSVPFDSTKLPVAESGKPNMYSPPLDRTYNGAVGHPLGIDVNPMFSKGNFGYSQVYNPEKSVNLTISNSSAFQIGNNNYLNVGGELDMKSSQGSNYQHQYAEVLASNSLLNESQMNLLRDNLSRKWKEFARTVGFRQPEIEEIDHDYDRDGLKEKVYQMLHRWQMKEGSKNATVGKVATALYCLKDTDLLNQLIMLN